jgi:hypothetical protein
MYMFVEVKGSFYFYFLIGLLGIIKIKISKNITQNKGILKLYSLISSNIH